MTMHGPVKVMKMKNSVQDLLGYSFTSNEEILIDANIWLYLFPAPCNPSKFKRYSTAFQNLIAASSKPILSPVVLSEYINRFCRIEWTAYKGTYPDFKVFRTTSEFKSIAKTCKVYAKNIVKLCTIHSVPSKLLDLNQALDDFESGSIDFNDALLVSICKNQNCKLLTNDSDFVEGGINILTLNQKLLKACV